MHQHEQVKSKIPLNVVIKEIYLGDIMQINCSAWHKVNETIIIM